MVVSGQIAPPDFDRMFGALADHTRRDIVRRAIGAEMRCRTAKLRPPEAAEPALQAEAEIGDADGVLELFWLLTTTLLGWLRPRPDLVLENLLLRHHRLAVLTRATRTRPRVRLRVGDKLL